MSLTVAIAFVKKQVWCLEFTQINRNAQNVINDLFLLCTSEWTKSPQQVLLESIALSFKTNLLKNPFARYLFVSFMTRISKPLSLSHTWDMYSMMRFVVFLNPTTNQKTNQGNYQNRFNELPTTKAETSHSLIALIRILRKKFCVSEHGMGYQKMRPVVKCK